MRKRIAVISGAVVLWSLGSVAAHAFEQTTLAPSPAAPIAVPTEPASKFSDDTKKSDLQKKSSGWKIPGLGKLPGVRKLSVPKLNFGLDLMYGSPENNDLDLQFSGEPVKDDDVTILGTFKRRF